MTDPSGTPRDGGPAAGDDGVREVDAATLRRWLDDGTCVLVDVREPAEHERERIPGSTLVPLSRLDSEELPDVGDRRMVLHCNTGSRSERAARRLSQRTRHETWHLAGGLEAWKRDGGDVRVDEDAPLPMERQVRIAAGGLVAAGTLLGATVSPWWLALSGFVGAGLAYSGVTGACGMARILGLLPYNRR